MKDINIYIGKKIKEYREDANLTQEYMAKELDVAPNHYGRIERGENACTMSNFIHICNMLHVSPNDILGGIVIASENQTKSDFDKLSLEDKRVISEITNFLLSKYGKLRS